LEETLTPTARTRRDRDSRDSVRPLQLPRRVVLHGYWALPARRGGIERNEQASTVVLDIVAAWIFVQACQT
jgi:hypothetical protein